MEIIHIAAGDYPRYEELLLQREQLQKEAIQYRRAYIREFGELINKIFEKKINCIALKKSIAFCQLAKNQGRKPDLKVMAEYVEGQMTAYRLKLKEMLSEYNSTTKDTTISADELQEIKTLYRKIARCLHPDISNLMVDNTELAELWERARLAYKCNDLKMLRETDFLIQMVISQLGGEIEPVVIPNLEERITELERDIHDIVTTEPYLFREILENADTVAEKMTEFETEFMQYCEYESQLKAQLDIMTEQGG